MSRNNPEDTFLALRIFQSGLRCQDRDIVPCSRLEGILEIIAGLLTESPQDVERCELDAILEMWIHNALDGTYFTTRSKLLSHPHL